jgi:DNA (cytosine-5)-methyltransferase 1
MSTDTIAVVDLFCGIGGLTHGLKKAGLNVIAGIDNDPTCRYAYEENNTCKFIEADITEFSSNDVNKLFGNASVKILVGCAPCQRFSRQANKIRNTFNHSTDKQWNLLNKFAEYIENIEPTVVSMENVPELRNYDIFQQFNSKLKALNYHINYTVVDCSKYGLPQKRRRLVLLASKYGQIKLIPEPINNKKLTVRDVLAKLPKLSNGEINKKDPLHQAAGLSDINLERLRQSKQGGTWHDWDKKLLPECYKKPSGKSYRNIYGRMNWDEPSPTITTQFFSFGSGRFGHPEQDRAVSLREGALLQTFPKNYKFFAKHNTESIATIGRHIGNAVPVDLGKIIGLSIKQHLTIATNEKSTRR